jgi:cell division protein FtsB
MDEVSKMIPDKYFDRFKSAAGGQSAQYNLSVQAYIKHILKKNRALKKENAELEDENGELNEELAHLKEELAELKAKHGE